MFPAGVGELDGPTSTEVTTVGITGKLPVPTIVGVAVPSAPASKSGVPGVRSAAAGVFAAPVATMDAGPATSCRTLLAGLRSFTSFKAASRSVWSWSAAAMTSLLNRPSSGTPDQMVL